MAASALVTRSEPPRLFFGEAAFFGHERLERGALLFGEVLREQQFALAVVFWRAV